jgi:hypothetical protein
MSRRYLYQHYLLRCVLASWSRVLTLNLDFDGDQFRRFHGRLRIPLYNGTLKIASLPCFPLQYARDAVDLRRGLLDRGRKFYEIVTKSRAEQVFTHSGTLRCARKWVWEDRHKTHDTFRLDRLRTKTEEVRTISTRRMNQSVKQCSIPEELLRMSKLFASTAHLH